MNKATVSAPQTTPSDREALRQAFLTFAGRMKGVSDPKVRNALEQLRRDLKRAKIDIDN